MLLSPAFVLSVVLASLYATLFHLIWGKKAKESLLYWLVALVAFGLGQLVARFLPWQVLRLGDVRLLEGTVFCWLALFVARWLKM